MASPKTAGAPAARLISFIGVSLVKETRGVPRGAEDSDAAEAERVTSA